MTTEACENAILTHLSSSPDSVIEDSYPWSLDNQLDHLKVVGAIKSLLAEDYIVAEDLATSFYSLEPEAETILANGSQEIIVLKALNAAVDGKLSMPALQDAVGKAVAKIGMGNCMKNKWVKKDGADLVAITKDDEVKDEAQELLMALKNGNFAPDAIDDKVSARVGGQSSLPQLTQFFAKLKTRNNSISHSFCSSICYNTVSSSPQTPQTGQIKYAEVIQS